MTSLIPFNTGNKALLVGPDGIFVLAQLGAIRLLPTEDQMNEHFESWEGESPDGPRPYQLSMEHGALSPDGKLIAVGHQDSQHFIFDAESLQMIGSIGPMSEYPHYAAFSADGKMIAFNSCHFYNGFTIGVPTRLLPNLKTEPYESDERLTELDDCCRVYAAVSRSDEFIIGDANGYLKAFDFTGTFRWDHFIGGTIEDIDISRDGKTLVATTYAGYLSIIDLESGTADPYAIGTGAHRERRRWIFWKNETKPLAW